ncbi:histidine triad nucleotide-binding protein [Pelagivirga sediminicola]|uniref:Histidine triad nucleotide-binding protein n=1 Tax=Pelagivirga sediminicola TaxID=2170575 RepID=A0A2T7G5P3_9RHOB|nr:HIT domain-containing protein [Pelagivirga sediminicola]PVA09741.1 histidine triad nucleotide-binding protein [Pelagivirga sediminicola]
MAHDYDDQNIFAKILRGEIPNDTVLETEHCLAFNDISPQAPVHVLVIPKGAYVSYDHFAAEASDAEIADFTRAIGEVCRIKDLSGADAAGGFRVISNAGPHGSQEVPHLHMHVLGGRPLGRLLDRE